MNRTLVDASTLISLAKVGHLDVLRKIFSTIYTTRVVRAEVLAGTTPDVSTIEAGFHAGWIKVIPLPRKQAAEKWEQFGLGPGEASLLAVAKKGDLLIVDDRNARRFAEARDFPHVGLLGLLVQAPEERRVTKKEALETLERLTTSDFRMSVDLYLWTKRQLEKIR